MPRFRAFVVLLALVLSSIGSRVDADESQWILRNPSTPPSARWDASIVYDSNSDRLILFGGSWSPSSGTPVTYYNDVWQYSLSTRQWSTLSTSGTAPSASAGHTAIYDSARDRMVLFGGSVSGVVTLSLGASPTWSTLSTSGGPPQWRENHVAIYDPVRDQMVVSGGPPTVVSTWKLTFSNNQWTQLPNLPTAEHRGAALYDPVNQRLLYFGGWTYSYGLLCESPAVVPFNAVVALNLANPTSWTTLPTPGWAPRGEIAAVWDGTRNRVLIFGGVGYSEHCFNCTYCGGQQRSMNEVPYGDVWAMNVTNNTWSQLSPTGTPPAARGHDIAAFDPGRDELTMFGGGHYITDDSQVNCLSVCSGTPIYTYRNDTWSLEPDVVAPAQVTNLQVQTYRNGATMFWTAPGDDGNTGQAVEYDLRVGYPGLNEFNFYSATRIPTGTPGLPGSYEYACTDVLSQFTWYCFAVKTKDEAGNWSVISNVPCEQTPRMGAQILCDASAWEGPSVFEAGSANGLPAALELALASPNPTSSEAALSFGVPQDLAGKPLELAVFDVAGRRVQMLRRGPAEAGRFRTAWDLRAESGSRVGPGIYFVRLTLGASKQQRSLMVVR